VQTLAAGRWSAFLGVLGVAIVAWLVIGAWVLVRRAMRLEIHERAVVLKRALRREQVVALADVRHVKSHGTAQDVNCVSLYLRGGGGIDLEGLEQMREVASLLERAHARPAGPTAPTGWVAPVPAQSPVTSAMASVPVTVTPGTLTAADLGRRLRLELVAGHPAFDFANPLAARSPGGLVLGSSSTHVESRLEGAPDGYPTRLSYLYRMDQRVESDILSKALHTSSAFECRFTVWARRAFPSFEVVSRAPTLAGGPIQRQLSLPLCATGHATLDAQYQVFAADPAVAAAIAPVLSHFDPFASSSGVQIVGEGGAVAFVMFEMQSPMMATALHQPELMQRAMTELAVRVGG
jgi:hypothetical protein